MPFDGKITDFAPVSVPTAKPFDFDTATPDERLLELARMLENEQEWRDTKMAWVFSATLERNSEYDCGTAGCAMGLAKLCWPGFARLIGRVHGDGYVRFRIAAESGFSLNPAEADDLFLRGGNPSLSMSQITPGMVATAIREFVAKRSAP